MNNADDPAQSSLQKLFNLPGDAEALPLSAIRQRAGNRLSEFAIYAQDALAGMDIAIPPAISFVSCPNCALEVNSTHPKSAEIQAWLDGSLGAQERFKKVEVLYELIHASENAAKHSPPTSAFMSV
ncbi:hypothetical protein [Craterilacuibacter sp. RT1T]|uniref:hypothetical protein n=1 Tax=Craterilacuibacter sp. RT1T TaxID=2942211 RepID=UPI0020C008FE|nr:hypothetical protein [Craterilacuibacter sp. RT1T]MCL6261903.1 hypothetical protein [Craterilacuibacter sp. RT1T]